MPMTVRLIINTNFTHGSYKAYLCVLKNQGKFHCTNTHVDLVPTHIGVVTD